MTSRQPAIARMKKTKVAIVGLGTVGSGVVEIMRRHADDFSRRAGDVRDYIRSYLVPDEHADPAAGNSYPVHSLYLDSPALMLFRSRY